MVNQQCNDPEWNREWLALIRSHHCRRRKRRYHSTIIRRPIAPISTFVWRLFIPDRNISLQRRFPFTFEVSSTSIRPSRQTEKERRRVLRARLAWGNSACWETTISCEMTMRPRRFFSIIIFSPLRWSGYYWYYSYLLKSLI